MIHVTQGHEKGIGLEVFFKSLLSINNSLSQKFLLYANPTEIKENLKFLNIPFKINDSFLYFENRKLKILWNQKISSPQSTEALLSALNGIRKGDVLLTLPTSKDQLIYEKEMCSGYTEFFRRYFSNNNITMIFKGVDGFTALLSDHIPLEKVTSYLTEELIIEKTRIIINGLKKYFHSNYSIIFAGINPHAGENGILGSNEKIIENAIIKLKNEFSNTSFLGPLPGDTLHFEASNRKEKVFIYSFHDQGLASFKQKNGLLGINTTLGLPFIRLSVDHGTAFELYGKNKANFKGCHFVIKEALRITNEY